MKKEDLFDVFGGVDNRYVKEVHMKNKKSNVIRWSKWVTLAACFAVLVFCVPMISNLSSVQDDNTTTNESSPIGNGNKVEVLQNGKEESANSEDIIQESENTEFKDLPSDTDGEYNEEVNSNDLTKEISDFFGGSYTDTDGEFVIILTEDTPENRTAICKELGRSESDTTFVKGTYTLAYLTELQTKITNAMVNKEIPFVVSSSVYEMTNNIVVGVTTNDETELAKLYAIDTIGGAIKVEFSDGAGTEDALKN